MALKLFNSILFEPISSCACLGGKEIYSKSKGLREAIVLPDAPVIPNAGTRVTRQAVVLSLWK